MKGLSIGGYLQQGPLPPAKVYFRPLFPEAEIVVTALNRAAGDSQVHLGKGCISARCRSFTSSTNYEDRARTIDVLWTVSRSRG
jgi:hypothetical protein